MFSWRNKKIYAWILFSSGGLINSAIFYRYEFFNDLYHRFLLTNKISMKCMCLQAMTIVYFRCHEEIGAFNDTRYIVGMLERVCIDLPYGLC